MKRALLLLSFFIFTTLTKAQDADSGKAKKPDTVKVGIYITSIHDIDFKQKEYNVNFWLWLKYKNFERESRNTIF